MALEREAIGLIASSCVLIVLLAFALIIFAVMCYRRLEKNKLSKLPKYGPSDVSAWASGITTTPAADIDTEVGVSNRIHGYRPKVLMYHKERSYRRQRHRSRELREDNYQQTIDGDRIVSVINVGGHSQTSPSNEISGNSQVVSGHIVTRPNGQYVYGHTSKAHLEEKDPNHVIHESDGRIVHGYLVEENVDVTTGHTVTSDVQMLTTGNNYVFRGPPPQAMAQELFIRPEAVKGHVIKQNVTVGQDGRLVVSSSREIELNESNGIEVSPLDGPQIVHGHYSTVHEDAVTSHRNQILKESPVVLTGHPSHSAVQSPTLISLALEGMTATGVSVTVPEIVVSQCEDNEPMDNDQHNHNSDDDDDEEYDRKRRENYKVIKKHSAYKIPEWIIKKVTEQDLNLDPETKDTVTQLEQRLITSQDHHRESISEIERRLSNFSVTTSPAPRRSTGVTFGEVTQIQDSSFIAYDSDVDDPDLSRRSSSMSVPPWGDNSTLSSRVEADDVRSPAEILVSRDGTVVTMTTTVQHVTNITEADHVQPSSFRITAGHPDGSTPESTFSEFSQQIQQFSSSTSEVNNS